MAVRRRHCVNPVAFGALADKRFQGKVGAAALAFGGQPPVGDKLISDRAIVRVVNKLNKLAAD